MRRLLPLMQLLETNLFELVAIIELVKPATQLDHGIYRVINLNYSKLRRDF
jgi:hypothetical protein